MLCTREFLMLTLMIINSLLSPTFLGFQKQTMIQQNLGNLTRFFFGQREN